MKGRPVVINGRPVYLIGYRKSARAARRLAASDPGLRYTFAGGRWPVFRPIAEPEKGRRNLPI